MPEVCYETRMALSVEQIWAFVQDMNNWAPMLTGYQHHVLIDDRNSVWTLKGDVGILSRTVKLEVHITEWSAPHRVRFTLTGKNEMVEGGGLFEMTADAGEAPTPGTSAAAPTAPTATLPARSPGPFKRLLRWFFGALFRRKYGTVTRTAERPSTGTGARLSFTLRMDAGGPTGPLVNALLEPALLPAAEDLGNKIAAHLESLYAPGKA